MLPAEQPAPLFDMFVLCCFSKVSCDWIFLQYEDVADKDDLMGVEDTAKKGKATLICVKVQS